MRSLRARLILSHILPLVLTLPLIGLALLYILQIQILLNSLVDEMQSQALLLVETTSQEVNLWQDPGQMQALITRISTRLNSKVVLLDPNGNIVASSDSHQSETAGNAPPSFNISQVLNGQASMNLQLLPPGNLLELWVPVIDQNQQVLGVVKLNISLANVWGRILSLRNFVIGVLAGGLLFGLIIGWVLALSLERPLVRATHAISELSSGHSLEPLPEKGPVEIRLMLHAFNNLAHRLRTLEENRRQLLANLVHELGRPLGALRSAIQALQGGADQEPELKQDLLKGMDDEIHRLQNLLDDLAHLHDQVAGILQLNLQSVDFNEWLSEVLAPWREAALAKGLQWKVNQPEESLVIRIDPDRLAQALGNLVSNAIKYTRSGGEVAIETTASPAGISIRIRDTGPGIHLDEKEKIFTPFYRGRSSRRFPQGMGLGLSIARDIVLAHGGKLEVESEPGKGSAFTLTLDHHT